MGVLVARSRAGLDLPRVGTGGDSGESSASHIDELGGVIVDTESGCGARSERCTPRCSEGRLLEDVPAVCGARSAWGVTVA